MSYAAVVDNLEALRRVRKELRNVSYGPWRITDAIPAPGSKGDYIVLVESQGEEFLDELKPETIRRDVMRIPGVKAMGPISAYKDRVGKMIENSGGESLEAYFEPQAKLESKSTSGKK